MIFSKQTAGIRSLQQQGFQYYTTNMRFHKLFPIRPHTRPALFPARLRQQSRKTSMHVRLHAVFFPAG